MSVYLNRTLFIICAALLFIMLSGFFFFGDNLYSYQKDTTKIKKRIHDSLSQQISDSIPIYNPLDKHGSIDVLNKESAFIKIGKRDICLREHNGFSEMMGYFVPAYPLFLGSPGMNNSFSFFGGKPSDIGITFNGRKIFSPGFPDFNLEQLSAQFFENLELLVGSDAVIQSDNSNSVLMNIQEIRYNTKTPYTHLWYAQASADGMLSADGIFSQNFAPNMNFTFGFRRQTGNGLYANSALDLWNVRGILRWNPSDLTSISLTEYFTNQKIGLSGGINKAESYNNEGQIAPYDEVWAQPYYLNFQNREYRHDLTLSITSFITSDSSTVVKGNLFISNSNFENRLDDELIGDSPDSSYNYKYFSRYYGLNISAEKSLWDFILKAGTEIYNVNLDQSVYHQGLDALSTSAFAHVLYRMNDLISISGGARIRRYNGNTIMNEGAKLNLNFRDYGSFFSDISLSERAPCPAEGLELASEKHFLFLNEYGYHSDNYKINFGAYFRNVADPITITKDSVYRTQNGNDESSYGVYLQFRFMPLKDWFVETMINSYQNDGDDTFIPELYAGLSTYYEIHTGRSTLRIGLAGKAFTSFRGTRYLPQYHAYMDYPDESGFMHDGLKVYASAKLGNAFIHASYENFLFSNYYYIPFYPNYTGNFRFSFSWSFPE
jgi:hypothetical protein